MTKPLFTHRLTVNVTLDMDRYLEELARNRTRSGKPVSKADLIREALRHYMDNQGDLNGSRRQIAKTLDGKLSAVTSALDTLEAQVKAFNKEQQVVKQTITTHTETLEMWRASMRKFVEWIENRERTRKG